jgi:hypothetical protein
MPSGLLAFRAGCGDSTFYEASAASAGGLPGPPRVGESAQADRAPGPEPDYGRRCGMLCLRILE